MKTLIRKFIDFSVCAALAGTMMPPVAGQNGEAVRLYGAKCKAASFARNPPGTQATTIRNMAIARCIKNKGYLD